MWPTCNRTAHTLARSTAAGGTGCWLGASSSNSEWLPAAGCSWCRRNNFRRDRPPTPAPTRQPTPVEFGPGECEAAGGVSVCVCLLVSDPVFVRLGWSIVVGCVTTTARSQVRREGGQRQCQRPHWDRPAPDDQPARSEQARVRRPRSAARWPTAPGTQEAAGAATRRVGGRTTNGRNERTKTDNQTKKGSTIGDILLA